MSYRILVKIAGLGLSVTLVAGCATGRPLMPTPNLHVDAPANPFADVPPALQSNEVDVLFLTDRKPEEDEKGNLRYGYGRSRSLAWGTATVELGRSLSWPELVEASQTRTRSKRIEVTLGSITEMGRGPGTPMPFTVEGGFPRNDPAVEAQVRETANAFHEELKRRLAQTSRKEVVFYVHGYNNTFEDAVFATAELWHFVGRKGVPIVYTWPAGRPGLFGYTYDRESSEFTVHHLKRAVRIISSWPEVEKIHFIAHSRGTDVALSALRELFIEAWAKGVSPRDEYRIQNLVLAAADLDFQVVRQRIVAEHVPAGVSRVTVYTSPDDQAIGIAESLFASPRGRVGRLEPSDLAKIDTTILETSGTDVSIINFSGTSDQYGHSYFRTNPAVSSDLLLFFDGYLPGSPERPLEPLAPSFWKVPQGYPNQSK